MMFSAPMVWALLAKRKTETRRLAGFKAEPGDLIWVRERWFVGKRHDDVRAGELPPRGMTVLYGAGGSCSKEFVRVEGEPAHVWKASDWPNYAEQPLWRGRSRASMHMPKWASRLTLRVTGNRREPLHDIDEAGAVAEGIVQDDGSAEGGNPFYLPGSHFLAGVDVPKGRPIGQHASARAVYRDLWANLNGLETWEANPVVSVLSFEPLLCNIEDAR